MNVFAFFIVTSSLAASWFRTCSAAQLTDAERKATSTSIIKTGRKLCPAHQIWCFCNGMKPLRMSLKNGRTDVSFNTDQGQVQTLASQLITGQEGREYNLV